MAKTLSWLRYVEFFMWRFMNHAALFGVSLGYLPAVFFSHTKTETERWPQRRARPAGPSRRLLKCMRSGARKKSLNV